MSDARRNRASLIPVIQRADEAAETEQFRDPPVRAGVRCDDWLVLASGDAEPGQDGQWLASDLVVDLEQQA
jgi:hypothetical protein